MKDTFIVLEEINNELQINSFVGLELENTSDYVWKIIHNFQSRPYETTLQAFSKLTDLFCMKTLFILLFLYYILKLSYKTFF